MWSLVQASLGYMWSLVQASLPCRDWGGLEVNTELMLPRMGTGRPEPETEGMRMRPGEGVGLWVWLEVPLEQWRCSQRNRGREARQWTRQGSLQ